MPSSRPYSRRRERLRLHIVLAAGVLTAGQIAFLILSGQLPLDAQAPQPEIVAVTTLPDNPPPPEPEPEVRVEPRPDQRGAPPPPAPVTRPLVPDPPMVLTREVVPPSPVTLPIMSRLPGNGLAPSPGDGNGDGVGSGDGAGAGAEPAPSGPRRMLFTRWAPSMDMRRLRDFYPEAARAQRMRGFARLDCEVIRRARVRDCRLLRERPEGQGFGAAALQAQDVYRIIVTDENRERVYNERIQLNAYFEPPR